VVGTGAAGLTLASRLLKSRASVVFLESGGMEIEPKTSDLNRGEISDLHFVGHRLGRSRVIGGSTRCWSGQLLPLEAQDFEERPWINQSGWPFDLSELENYYKKALHLLGADDLNFDSDLLEFLDVADQPFDKTRFRFYFAKWSPHPDLRSSFMSDFEASTNSTLLYYANLIKIHLSDDLNRVTKTGGQESEAGVLSYRVRKSHLVFGWYRNSQSAIGQQSSNCGRHWKQISASGQTFPRSSCY
jgi:hypothetical protein